MSEFRIEVRHLSTLPMRRTLVELEGRMAYVQGSGNPGAAVRRSSPNGHAMTLGLRYAPGRWANYEVKVDGQPIHADGLGHPNLVAELEFAKRAVFAAAYARDIRRLQVDAQHRRASRKILDEL